MAVGYDLYLSHFTKQFKDTEPNEGLRFSIADFASEYMAHKDADNLHYKPFSTLEADQVQNLTRSLIDAWNTAKTTIELDDRNEGLTTESPVHQFERFKKRARRAIDWVASQHLEIDPNMDARLAADNTQAGVIDDLRNRRPYDTTLLTSADMKASLGDMVKPIEAGRNSATLEVSLTEQHVAGVNPLTARLRDIQGQLQGAGPDVKTKVLIPLNQGNGHWTTGVFNFTGATLDSASLIDSMSQASGETKFRDALTSFNLPAEKINIVATGQQSMAGNYTHCGDYTLKYIAFQLERQDHPLYRANTPQEIREATVTAIIQSRPELAQAAIVAPPAPAVTVSPEPLAPSAPSEPKAASPEAILTPKKAMDQVTEFLDSINNPKTPVAPAVSATLPASPAPEGKHDLTIKDLLRFAYGDSDKKGSAEDLKTLIDEQTRALEGFKQAKEAQDREKAAAAVSGSATPFRTAGESLDTAPERVGTVTPV